MPKKKGRRKGLSSTQRTLRALRNEGVIADISERFIQHAGPHGIRMDLFGFIDVVALCPGRGIVGVQCCTTDVRGHIRKITEECTENAIAWLECNGHIEVWGWRKLVVKRGGKAKRWMPRIISITMDDFTQ